MPDGQQARCGLGMRMPLQVISSFTRTNFVDHSLTDRSSILRFTEDNWALGRAGAGSRDAWAGSLNPMFDFGGSRGRARRLLLDPDTGAVADADRDD